MAEGGEKQTPFRKEFQNIDESINETSCEDLADRPFCEASNEVDTIDSKASCDVDQPCSKTSNDNDEVASKASCHADQTFFKASNEADGADSKASADVNQPYTKASKASADGDESFCDPCKSDHTWIAASGFCPICDEYLCIICLGVHKKQKFTRSHSILDRKDMPHRERTTIHVDLYVNVCEIHAPQVIQFYCAAHEQSGCRDCMILSHPQCIKSSLNDLSGQFNDSKEFKEIHQRCQKSLKDLEEIDDKIDDNLTNLDSKYGNILHKIHSKREQIKEYFDRKQETLTDEVAELKKTDETQLAQLKAMKYEIKTTLDTLQNSGDNMNKLFITTKEAKHRLVDIDTEIDKYRQKRNQECEFRISNEINSLMSNEIPLGKLSRISRKKTMASLAATYNRRIYMKLSTDKKTCCIKGSALLNPDRLVVTDYANNNVKLIDLATNTIISSYKTQSHPRQVTAINQNQIAITLHQTTVLILNVTPTFTLERKIKFADYVHGIAYKDGKLAVSTMYTGTVEILDMKGTVLRTIKPIDERRYYLIPSPLYITFGPVNDTVIVSLNSNSTIRTVTFDGTLLGRYANERLENPRGIATTKSGVLYVCSQGGKCIHAVSPDFKTSKIIIEKDSNITNPRSITYCETKHMLYISNAGDDHIQVYELND